MKDGADWVSCPTWLALLSAVSWRSLKIYGILQTLKRNAQRRRRVALAVYSFQTFGSACWSHLLACLPQIPTNLLSIRMSPVLLPHYTDTKVIFRRTFANAQLQVELSEQHFIIPYALVVHLVTSWVGTSLAASGRHCSSELSRRSGPLAGLRISPQFLALTIYRFVELLRGQGRKLSVKMYEYTVSSAGGLRFELSPSAPTLALRVRIPLEAQMSVCVYSAFTLFCG
jgi:hypothetical protein